MKHRVLFAVALAAAAFAVSACVKKSETIPAETPPPNPYEVQGVNSWSAVVPWLDPHTGCWYLVYDGYQEGGITPRMGPDGKQVCVVNKLPN